MDRNNVKKVLTKNKQLKTLYECIMINTVPYGSELHIPPTTIISWLISKGRANKTSLLTKTCLSVFWRKRLGEWTFSRKMPGQKEQED